MQPPARSPWNAANLVSGFRLAMAPILVLLAVAGLPALVLAGLAASLISDAADGLIARRYNLTSELGASLDSWGDVITWVAVTICAFVLWPDVLRRESPYIVTVLASCGVPIGFGFWRYGRLTSYHTRAIKIAAVLIGIGLFLLFAGGPPIPFRVATVILVLAEAEEAAITAVLPVWRANVSSLRHALDIARSLRSDVPKM